MTPPLLFRTDPKSLKSREAGQLAKQGGLSGAAWKGLSWALPCFKEKLDLVELSEEGDIDALRHYFIKHGETLTPAEYKSGVVEDLAARFGLHLTRDTADEYVRLYLGLTRGQGGRIIPIEQVDHLPLREELTLITRRKLQAGLTPLIVQDARHVTGCFLIGDKLFSARADIDGAGTITMEPLSLIADTLPVLDSVLEN